MHECVSRGLAVIQGDADKDLADFPDASFDYVILSQTIQAMRDPQRVLQNMLRIGRFGNNDLVIDHPTVSAYHAEISLRPDGRHELTDRESRNGTRINGTPIRSAVLRDGDLITIGAVSLHYLIRPPAEGSLGSIPQPSRNRLG